jgi:alpha/beta superfamily hydrolase
MRARWLANEKEVMLNGPCGQLQAGFISGKRADVAMLVCHPHPLHQGTMFNKVVTTAVKAACDQQMSTLRFNYRGVGLSEGSYGDVEGEARDALSAAQWLLNTANCQHLWLVGFSFGAAVSYQIQPSIPNCGTVLICPSVERMAFSKSSNAPIHVIQAANDEVVSPQAVTSWCKEQANVNVQLVPGASHFFHGKLPELKACLTQILEDEPRITPTTSISQRTS